MALGNVTAYSHFLTISKVTFKGVDDSYVSGIQIKSDDSILVNGIALGRHSISTIYDIQSAAFSVVLKNGYTIKLDSFGTNLIYEDDNGNEYAKIHSAFGNPGSEQIPGLLIKCTKEDDKLTTEFTFNIRYIDSFVELGRMALKLEGTIGDVGQTEPKFVNVFVKENQFGDTISFSVSNYSSHYSLLMDIGKKPLVVFSVTAENVNYAENVKDGITVLSADNIDIVSTDGDMGI